MRVSCGIGLRAPTARAIVCFITLCALLIAPRPCSAALLSLVDGNSSADFDTATPSNQYNWFIDNTDRMAQQALWYRVGAAGPEQSVHTLPIGVQGTTDANFDGNPDTLFVRYNGAGFRVETTYNLRGGAPGSGSANINAVIQVLNLTAAPLAFHLFQYTDLDVSAADTVQLGKNLQGLYNEAYQSTATTAFGGGLGLPGADHGEVAFFPVTLNKLNDGLPTTLIDNSGPLGPGDVTWAFEWDPIIAPSGSFSFSSALKDPVPTPEPSTVAIALPAMLALVWRRARRPA
jgi:hypothetical protein